MNPRNNKGRFISPKEHQRVLTSLEVIEIIEELRVVSPNLTDIIRKDLRKLHKLERVVKDYGSTKNI